MANKTKKNSFFRALSSCVAFYHIKGVPFCGNIAKTHHYISDVTIDLDFLSFM